MLPLMLAVPLALLPFVTPYGHAPPDGHRFGRLTAGWSRLSSR